MTGSELQAMWGVNPRGLQSRLPTTIKLTITTSPHQGPPAGQTLMKSVAASPVIFYEYEEGAHFTDGETETRG